MSDYRDDLAAAHRRIAQLEAKLAEKPRPERPVRPVVPILIAIGAVAGVTALAIAALVATRARTAPPVVVSTHAAGDLRVAAGATESFDMLSSSTKVTWIEDGRLGVESTARFVAGQEVLLIDVQGSRADSSAAGNYETSTIVGVNTQTKTIVLVPSPSKTYGASEGQTVLLVQIPHFETATIDGKLSARSRKDGGAGIIAFRAKDVIIGPSGSIDASGLGFISKGYSCNGVAGFPGESVFPQPPQAEGSCGRDKPTSEPNGGGGGGGLSNCNTYNCKTQEIGAGGGGGGHGTRGTAGLANGELQKGGAPGLEYGDPELSKMYLGAGGGGGAGGFSGPGNGTDGGHGGGIVFVTAESIVSRGGSIRAKGLDGGTNNNCGVHGSGSGGGGAGGTIYLRARTMTVDAMTSITARGGAGGCNGGGAGGDGRIRIDSATLKHDAAGIAPRPFLGRM